MVVIDNGFGIVLAYKYQFFDFIFIMYVMGCGLGLGFFIVRRIVQVYGGDVFVDDLLVGVVVCIKFLGI